jgi:cardiolipin synthase A/B
VLKRKPPHTSSSNQVTLIKGGAEYFKLLKKLIDEAEEVIHLQFYIFNPDETGTIIAEALKEAGRRGVRIYMLLDAYGSQGLSNDFVKDLRDAGIHFKWFQPLLRSRKFYLGRRLHHKVVVVDSYHSLVCGLNVSDRYNDMPDAKAWLDWALYSTGEVSKQLEEVCRKKIRVRSHAAKVDHKEKAGTCVMGVRINDWVGRKSEITRSYLTMLKEANTQVTLMSPYFLPGYKFRRMLKAASKRGVKIRVILTGNSDVPFAKYAERFMYDWLFRYKIEIFEYQKNVLHGKIATADGQWSTVGSYNVNNLSAYASIELNLEVRNETLAKEIDKRLEEIIEKDCEKITKQAYERQVNVVKRLAQGAAYNFFRFMLFIFTIRIRHPE